MRKNNYFQGLYKRLKFRLIVLWGVVTNNVHAKWTNKPTEASLILAVLTTPVLPEQMLLKYKMYI